MKIGQSAFIKNLVLVTIYIFCSMPASASTFEICALDNNPDDWKGMWAWRHIEIPARSAFDQLDIPSCTADSCRSTSGLITLVPVTLTEQKPCAEVKGASVDYSPVGWTGEAITGSAKPQFYIYGLFLPDNSLQTTWGALNAPPADGFQAAIELYDNNVVAIAKEGIYDEVTVPDPDGH